MAKTENKTVYNVACLECDSVFNPLPGSPLWWRAKQKADRGLLDAVYVDGDECGCQPKEVVLDPKAPYRVFGYDMLCQNFDFPFYRIVDAMKKFIELNSGPDVVFITGVSPAVEEWLHYHSTRRKY